jgi:predicted HD phosphohydrolase
MPIVLAFVRPEENEMSQPTQSNVQSLIEPLHASVNSDYIGEDITQLEHALQCAYWAQKSRAPDEVVLAALFHDVGHLIGGDAPQMDGLGVVDHETLGAQFLIKHGCSKRIGKLVAAHVGAKRYLCHRKPAYYRRLSDASKGTLKWQGGPMTEEEALAFESSPDFKFFLALRSWDELAKDPDANVPQLDSYIPMLTNHLETHAKPEIH